MRMRIYNETGNVDGEEGKEKGDLSVNPVIQRDLRGSQRNDHKRKECERPTTVSSSSPSVVRPMTVTHLNPQDLALSSFPRVFRRLLPNLFCVVVIKVSGDRYVILQKP